jgi:hypothetical protein
MRRKEQIITTEQIKEVIDRIERDWNNPTLVSLRLFLEAELDRREKAGRAGGRPVAVEDKKAANREYQRRYRERNKK